MFLGLAFILFYSVFLLRNFKNSFDKLDEEDKKKVELFSVREESKDSIDNDVIVSKDGEVLLKHFTRSTSWFHMF